MAFQTPFLFNEHKKANCLHISFRLCSLIKINTVLILKTAKIISGRELWVIAIFLKTSIYDSCMSHTYVIYIFSKSDFYGEFSAYLLPIVFGVKNKYGLDFEIIKTTFRSWAMSHGQFFKNFVLLLMHESRICNMHIFWIRILWRVLWECFRPRIFRIRPRKILKNDFLRNAWARIFFVFKFENNAKILA